MNGIRILMTVAVCALLASFAFADETIHYREGGGTGYTGATFDDTYISHNPADWVTSGDADWVQASGSKVMLLAVKDLFTDVPATSGGCDIQINSATMHLFKHYGTDAITISLYRMTTDWLPDSAGANEDDVSGECVEESESTTWASGDFSTSDHDTSACVTRSWVNGWHEDCAIDITALVEDIYDNETNYGVVMYASGGQAIALSSEVSTASIRPSLEITYEYTGGTTYTLTVNSGTGDGSYAESAVADIDADTAPSGQDFDEWVGDTAGIASVATADTTLTMPSANQEVTATYADKTWTLTVNNGAGDGSYVVGTIQGITADAAPSGQDFDDWTGDVTGIADVNDPTTTITMPYADAEITATYTDKTWTLTVNNGAGDGSYVVGTIQGITADTAPSGQDFDDWTGDVSGIADVNDPTTTITMPYADAEITATYVDKTWTLTVNSGTGDGSYVVGAIQGITADAAPSGQDFDDWTGDVTGIADVNDPTTTITMPYADAEITATYTDKTWTLTVNSGTGDGPYVVGAVADIDADAPASGKQFDAWTGDVAGIPDVNVADTTLTMPYADAEITATYEDIPTYALTVNNGSGDGSYPEDQVVDITADAAPSGQDFDEWTGDTSGIADTSDPTTTITMAAAAAEITATYTDKTWTLTVNNGTGDGSYVVGTVQGITADAAPSGQDFDDWTGDVSGIADVNDSTTTITMPYADAEITATYADKTWTLTVNSGTGDGSYVVGAVADIDADAAPSGQQFDEWTGDVSGIASVSTADTTLTMPYANAEITATYEAASGYSLTVNNGTGDGSYAASTVVDITADAAASGRFFDKWTGDISGIADINDPSTTLTMPAADAEVTAVYAYVVSGLVSRYTFDIDASDSYGTNDGTLTGGASVTTDGTRGEVLSLDGTDDYIDLPAGNMAAGRSEVTLTMWINADEWVGSNAIYDEDNNNWWQYTITETAWYTRDSSTGTSGSRDNDVSMPSVSTGSWHHLAFVYSVTDDRKEIWYDGSIGNTSTTSIDALTSSRTEARLGWPSDGSYYDGLVDDLRLYSRALTAAEIALLAEADLYTLTVNSGTGDGSYAEDAIADIEADAAPSGQEFDEWVGNTSGIASVTSSSTTLTMPASNQETTATYTDKTWTLTVNSGTGDGSYVVATVVDIDADTPASGTVFDGWSGDIEGIENIEEASTTLTMPYADAEITATYVNVYILTVNSGTGDGTYQEDVVVAVTADTAASGYVFDDWIGDTDDLADASDPTTTVTMPASDVEITATYDSSAQTYALTVNSGTGDGNYEETEIVAISADTAPSGQFFDAWTGDVTGVGDVNDPTTTYTMPGSVAEITATYTEVVSGLVSRYTFDTDARDTYGANDGTFAGGASVTTDGTRGSVLSLDGTDDYVDLPSSAMAAGRSEVTLTMWIKPDEWVSSNTIYDEYAATNYWQFSVNCSTWYTRDSSTGTTGSRDNDISMPSASTGTWHHLAFVYSDSGDDKEIWYDGELYASTSTSIDTLTSDRDGARIGYPCDGAYYDGLIDDVRLYSRALNQTEISLLAEEPLYTLTVNSGTGDGDYIAGEIADIQADAPASGKVFNEWVGDTSGMADVDSSTTTLTMPSANAEITATYEDAGTYYTLTVNSGTGDGIYTGSTVVDISADSAASGYEFDDWVGDTTGIADTSDPTTTLTMPASNAEITATYQAATMYTLTVNSGSGDGSYQEDWVVDIDADSPASGKTFDEWVGDTSGIANVNAEHTTLTMPASNAEITATYTDVSTGGPTVTGYSGTLSHGSSITISGSGFGSKATAAPIKWETFEDGVVGQSITTTGYWSAETPSQTLFDDGTPVSTRHSHSDKHIRWYSPPSSSTRSFYKDNIGFEATGKAYVNTWLYIDFVSGDPELSTGWQFKLFRIQGGHSHASPPYFINNLCTLDDQTVSYWVIPIHNNSSLWPGSGWMVEHYWVNMIMEYKDSSLNSFNGQAHFYSSDAPLSDGPYRKWSRTNIETRHDDVTDWVDCLLMGYLLVNGGDEASSYWDDVYIDNSWSRVEIGDASTYANCKHREMQIPSAWSSSSVTVTVNEGSHSSLSGKYLFVVDDDGNVSAGYGL